MEPDNQIREMRTCPRYPIDVRAKVIFPKDGFLQAANVRTVDIGMGGVALSSPLEIPVGQSVDFEVTLPGNKAPMRVKSVVRSKSGSRYGLEFVSVSDAQKDEITRFGNGRKPASMVGAGFPTVPAMS